jgi:hypothetical protein
VNIKGEGMRRESLGRLQDTLHLRRGIKHLFISVFEGSPLVLSVEVFLREGEVLGNENV